MTDSTGRQILAQPRQGREAATVGEFLWVFCTAFYFFCKKHPCAGVNKRQTTVRMRTFRWRHRFSVYYLSARTNAMAWRPSTQISWAISGAAKSSQLTQRTPLVSRAEGDSVPATTVAT